ncbi:HCP-like protein [Parathielavia appendiculata]|uniref:HCP-like protein n=1 Tax=Parathielavia appendiculata TaxID=2587402 RepID=A0AAN6UA07_9PEZI|nr:HCP-like protein [Parathielavia appendiculata]
MKGLLWLFLLLQAITISYAKAQPNQHVLGGDTTGETDGNSFRAEIDAQRGRQMPREPGADLVDSALIELRKLYQPLHYQARKQHGFVSTLLHFALKALPTLRLSAPAPESSRQNVPSGKLLHATGLLEESARRNNSDALYLIAEMNFYGNFSHPKNFQAAFDYYHRLALLNGNSSALYMVGLMYSTGIGGAVERDQARALLYYTFAAERGHTRAEMTVAHRHHAGIGTPKNCELAIKYYKRVADKAIAWYRSGPPGGRSWISEAYRIADETGGAYGEGASVASAGSNAIKAHPSSDAYASIEDVIEYLDLMSQKGDFKASFNLGRIYYDGQRGLDKNMVLARKYFFDVAQKYWKKGRPIDNPKAGLDKTAAKAAGYIGRMYLRGEGVEQNFDRAKFWFERGVDKKDAQSYHGLGLLYLHGYGVKADPAQAIDYFKLASALDYGPSQVQLGYLYLDHGSNEDVGTANHYFELAARWANIEAFYHLGEVNNMGWNHDRSCSSAVTYYKSVAERAEPLVSSWAEANLAFESGDTELALLEYLGAAEQGYEKAQNNVAHILDPAKSSLPIPRLLSGRAPTSPLLRDPTLALIFWTRSSRQGNIDALVKMGDYYFHGIGTDADVDKAVQCYTGASEYQQSAQALYNLGWMHEHGVGLEQDYHLAKRYYDAAVATNEEAYLPVALSLLKLRVKSAWNTLTHGRINSIQDEPAPRKEWSLTDWINNFLQDEAQYYDDVYDDLYEDHDTMPGGDPLDFDDGIMESVVILGLAAFLAFLIMYRQQRQQAARQQEEDVRRRQQQHHAAAQGGAAVEDQQQPQQERGFFPRPGDPDFGQWGVGGVGH